MPEAASAATGGATGCATGDGGATGGAGGQTVRATTGTAIHEALCGRAGGSTSITIEVEGTINHANTGKVSGDSCNTADGVIELKQFSNVTIGEPMPAVPARPPGRATAMCATVT
ncbi:hypothetical protein GCM10010377_60570 [Streptomyces viridiviolaceus]|nr:hypothetical protein GCM10010377_60570 [Streptomyces viridiviolaceus]